MIDATDGPAPIVIGFASAGHVVLRLAAEHGDRIVGTVCINGSPRFMRTGDWPYGFDTPALEHFAGPLRQKRLDTALDRILDPDSVLRDVPAAQAQQLACEFRIMGENAGVKTLLGFFDSIALDDDRPLMPSIEKPVLLISAAIGSEVPSGVALALRTQIAHAHLAEIAGADHFVFATRPTLVNALIEDFVGAIG